MTDPPSCERDRNRYETILESLEDGVYAVDPDGILVYVNDRYAEMKGVSRETLLGTHVHEWATDAAVTKATSAREAIATGDEDRGVIEYDFETASGETFPVEMRFDVVPEHDDLDRVGVVRDITERKRREEALREKNERLDEFASIVSHDLRNPLSVTSGYIRLAQQTGDVTYLDRAASALDRMQSLIDDLLELARSDDPDPDTEVVDLRRTTERAWAVVPAGTARLDVTTDRRIRAEPTMLRQLVENLLHNAATHGGEGVTVTVSDLPDGFAVADDGRGIPATDRERVFETGYSTDDDGTGFGLPLVREVAEAHGWEVSLTDGEHGGARCEITGVEVVED